MTNETALLERAKTYDSAAISELYDLYAPRMYAYIYRRVSDAALAEDLTGEVFVRMLRAIQNERAWRDSFSAWLYRIAHNLVVDHYRRNTPELALSQTEALVSPDGDPAAATEEALTRQKLTVALEQLTADQQQVLALRFGEGLTAEAAAKVMQKTTGAVEALQHRAIAALQRILSKEGVSK
ncbi:MAG: sigma-70 family RNA polymerase sigma factor [Chloroflexota bacterium]